MISKELLSEMLGINIAKAYHDSNAFEFENENGDFIGSINIHELAHKVKEWAFENSYSLHSYRTSIGSWKVEIFIGACDEYFIMVSENSEPEAIFKAGQWILENR